MAVFNENIDRPGRPAEAKDADGDRKGGPASADFTARADRVAKYLTKYAARFVFDTFSEDFLKRGDLLFLRGVPVPLREEDAAAFRSDAGLSLTRIGENMACVTGASPSFPYAGAYVEFLRRGMGGQTAAGLIREAKNAAERAEYDAACIRFRAALCLEPRNPDALYGYARVCRAMYLAGDDSEYVGRFKAEALEYFELTTEAQPSFSEAHYYLGYAYLNMGLYQKAHLAWERCLKHSSRPEERREIKERMLQLADPIEIERGCNAVLAGRFAEGFAALEPYLRSKYGDWWPLCHCLGLACVGLHRRDEAADLFKRALRLNPSHVESMKELADLYETEGKKDLSEKYRRKAALLSGGGYAERSETTNE
jgi:tetratricopeptide (TPR) repeat protein